MSIKINNKVSFSAIKQQRDAFVKMVGKKFALLLAIASALVVGGITTTFVIADIPDSNKSIHACYTNNRGAVRIIDDSSDSCDNNETALNWDQTAPKLKYTSSASEVSLTPAESEAAGHRADLGGPDVTVSVPSGAGSVVHLMANMEAKSNCEVSPVVTLIDETNEDDFGDGNGAGFIQIFGEGNTDTYTLATLAKGKSSAGYDFIVPASAGTHTYSFRYTAQADNSEATCPAFFQNMKLWAEVVSPS